MRTRLVLLLALIVILPLGFLARLGFRVADEEQARTEKAFEKLLRDQMQEMAGQISLFMDDRKRELVKFTDSSASQPGIPTPPDQLPLYTTHFFHQKADGTMLFPDISRPLTEAEHHFLARTHTVFDQKRLLAAPEKPTAPASKAFKALAPVSPPNPPPASEWQNSPRYRQESPTPPQMNMPGYRSVRTFGWFTWYWDFGLQLLFWRQTPDAGVLGFAISRERLISDLIGILPNTTTTTRMTAPGCFCLTDDRHQRLYRWGTYFPADQEEPKLTVSLLEPLQIWSIRFYSATPTLAPGRQGGAFLTFLAAFLSLSVVLLATARYIYRENTRELREAAERVSFVNQVSHELKTPLTNIRMHAELLDLNLPEDDQESRRRVDILVSESRRLSRLINNVLSFSKQREDRLVLRLRAEIPDEIIQACLKNFHPAFEVRGIHLDVDLQTGNRRDIDADILEQILGNLLSNIEKYAAGGGSARILSRQTPAGITLFVADQGPGIPRNQADHVFEPFVRLSDHVSEGAAGTGIGLSIARTLARLHLGDLTLVYPEDEAWKDVSGTAPKEGFSGCCFRLFLHAPIVSQEENS
jgi:signal transduction histidine kinase